MSDPSIRVNVSLSLEMMIQVEKSCEKLGMSRIQFIKEAIIEKIREPHNHQIQEELKHIRKDINELKNIVLLLVGK